MAAVCVQFKVVRRSRASSSVRWVINVSLCTTKRPSRVIHELVGDCIVTLMLKSLVRRISIEGRVQFALLSCFEGDMHKYCARMSPALRNPGDPGADWIVAKSGHDRYEQTNGPRQATHLTRAKIFTSASAAFSGTGKLLAVTTCTSITCVKSRKTSLLSPMK